MKKLVPPYCVIDGVLGEAASGEMLGQILASEGGFAASRLRATVDASIRSSLSLPQCKGVDTAPLVAALGDLADRVCRGTGVAPFAVTRHECDIVAHRDGDFYRTHIDTHTGQGNTASPSIRMISCVYYLHSQPKGFSGGELMLHPVGGPFDGQDAITIAPVHDRLVAFASFLPHEVRPIACPSGRFADIRFSMNCWLHRAR